MTETMKAEVGTAAAIVGAIVVGIAVELETGGAAAKVGASTMIVGSTAAVGGGAQQMQAATLNGSSALGIRRKIWRIEPPGQDAGKGFAEEGERSACPGSDSRRRSSSSGMSAMDLSTISAPSIGSSLVRGLGTATTVSPA